MPRLLLGLANQVASPAFAVCLFFDNCDDGSQALAASLSEHVPYSIRVDRCDRGRPPNAGLARARAMAAAEAAAPDGVVLTTDADSEPRADWLANNLAGLKVADLVAGQIMRNGRPAQRQDAVEAYYHRLHAMRRRIDPVPWEAEQSHHWTSAASLSMRTATYRALGGFRPIVSGEDAALCDTAARAGRQVRRDADVVVRTSARRSGRATGGFAAALAMLDEDASDPLIAHPEDEAWRFHMQAEARSLHGTGQYSRFATRLRLSIREVERVAAECRNGEAFAARIVGAPPGGMRSMSFGHAELMLAALEQDQMKGAA